MPFCLGTRDPFPARDVLAMETFEVPLPEASSCRLCLHCSILTAIPECHGEAEVLKKKRCGRTNEFVSTVHASEFVAVFVVIVVHDVRFVEAFMT